MSQSVYEFVNSHQFAKPIHRLIMLRVLAAGSLDGLGERKIDHDVLANFCCCSRQAMFKELKVLERAGYLQMRKMDEVTLEATVRIEPVRGYTIIVNEARYEQ
ncbi:transcriptional regulator [Superficieibacter sp. HKU1]|uniref:transcriptional regulator n=1 Tax=Superficieibacter sp. HKU1 TaxID=3031919 RepID=UPI0023E205F9|nr:transcriptional regulator [Superficieibacter sp. HKU1]WES69139.1 transcriptional regulator [Superficieibacter sp. HKU1]